MPESGETVRAFVAVLLSEAAAREAERLLERLRPLARCRWVTREQLHITLRFLGELSLAVVERVRSTVAAVTVQPFDIELHRAGTFPNLARPRTLWLGGDRGAPELTALAGRVNDALFEVGIPRNGRPFSPHLTLARSDGSPAPGPDEGAGARAVHRVALYRHLADAQSSDAQGRGLHTALT